MKFMRLSMKFISLKDLCNINMGQSPPSETYNKNGEGLPFFQGNADFGKKFPNPKIYCGNPIKIAEKNDILISVRAPIGAINFANEKSCIGRGLAAITVNLNKASQNYIYYLLKSKESELKYQGTGSTFKAISKNILENIAVPDIDIERQQKIVDVLDKVENLIDNRQQQLNLLDELIESRFIEMFGDPVTNPMGWETCPISEKCNYMVPGRDKPKSFTGNIPWITIEDLNVNGITYESKSKLGLTKFEIEEVKRKVIPKDSIIMSCVGNLGICSIAGCEMIINQQLHSFQCEKEINNIYLMYYLGFRTDYMNKNASSTTVLYMNKTFCNYQEFSLPPHSNHQHLVHQVLTLDMLQFS